MFDIGFSEIALIALVALIVLGPERLPRVARTVGALVRRARNSWQGVKSEIERELAADDLKRTLTESRQAADVRHDLRAIRNDLSTQMRGNSPTAPVPPIAPSIADSSAALPANDASRSELSIPKDTPDAPPGDSSARHDRD